MKKVDLSIIILSYNTKKLLENCLQSVIGDRRSVIGDQELEIGEKRLSDKPITGHRSPTTEIIIVDNGSTDGSREYLRDLWLKGYRNIELKIILSEKNLGFARGNNIGIKAALGKYIMLLNSDTVVKRGAIENLVNFLEKNNFNKLAVSPLLLLPNGQPQVDYYMRFPNLWQIFFYHNPFLRPGVLKIPFIRNLIAQKPSLKPFEVDQLPGAALIASRNVWEKVGLLDEEYKFLFEDVDWCWRAKKLGIKLMVVPEAKIIHVGGASWKQKARKNPNEFFYQFFASMLLFVKKNYGEIKGNIFKWAIILNFCLTLKPACAWRFFKNKGRQLEFLK